MKEEENYTCAVCNGPMEVKGECPNCKPPAGFEPKYFWAFMTMLTHIACVATRKDRVSISLEHLEKFDPKECPNIFWDPENKAWVIQNKPMAEESVIIAVSQKVLKPRRGSRIKLN